MSYPSRDRVNYHKQPSIQYINNQVHLYNQNIPYQKQTLSSTGGVLFMGIMSAVRFDENFKAFYERLLANHKHTTQAQIAVMRKVIVVAHSLYKNNKKYDKNYRQSKEKSGE